MLGRVKLFAAAGREKLTRLLEKERVIWFGLRPLVANADV